MTYVEFCIDSYEKDLDRINKMLELQQQHLKLLLYPTISWFLKAQASGQFKPRFEE